MKKLIKSQELKDYFEDRDYEYIKPYNIVNNNDTVFVSAGIQPLLADYRKGLLKENKKLYISQPVIRTQFAKSVAEGFSIAFVNSTTAAFNLSQAQHNDMVNEWLSLFYELGIKKQHVTSRDKDYERQWGDLIVKGHTKFYYCDGIELGDTTFFTQITKDGQKIDLETMSDIGFGLERIRWVVTKNPYFDLYSDSSSLLPEEKACLSVLALLVVNDVTPSNKNSGYRVRLFSKSLVSILNGKDLSLEQRKYFDECISYWKDWQQSEKEVDIKLFFNEYVRNCNRFILDRLQEKGYGNISGIDINIPREEFKKRVVGSCVKKEDIKEFNL